MSLNLNSLNNGPAPVAKGPPIGLIVGVIVVIIVVVVLAVMFGGSPPPPPVAQPSPPPVTAQPSPVAAAPSKDLGVKIDTTIKPPSSVPTAAWEKKDNVAHYLADPQYARKKITTMSGTVDSCKLKCEGTPECTHFDFLSPSTCTLFNGAEWVGSNPGSSSYCKAQCQK